MTGAKFSVMAVRGGFVVAYRRPDGTMCSVLDCATREAAQREADSRNRYAAKYERKTLEQHREHAFVNRRPVRFFEPDAFA